MTYLEKKWKPELQNIETLTKRQEATEYGNLRIFKFLTFGIFIFVSINSEIALAMKIPAELANLESEFIAFCLYFNKEYVWKK